LTSGYSLSTKYASPRTPARMNKPAPISLIGMFLLPHFQS
jgi:hypothetical protein